MHLEIITPDKKIFEGDVSIVTFPGSDGSFQVMNNHAPLISLLKAGTVEYKISNKREHVNITGGDARADHLYQERFHYIGPSRIRAG